MAMTDYIWKWWDLYLYWNINVLFVPNWNYLNFYRAGSNAEKNKIEVPEFDKEADYVVKLDGDQLEQLHLAKDDFG